MADKTAIASGISTARDDATQSAPLDRTQSKKGVPDPVVREDEVERSDIQIDANLDTEPLKKSDEENLAAGNVVIRDGISNPSPLKLESSFSAGEYPFVLTLL